MINDAERAERMRILNIQRCAEAMDLLYTTYIIDAQAASFRGNAITAINELIIRLGGDDTASKIEAVPWSARMRKSGEQDLVDLEMSVRKNIGGTDDN